MIQTLTLTAALAMFGSSGADDIRCTAQLETPELEVGETYEVSLSLGVPDDLSVPEGRRMKHSPILQLDTPSSVELEGKHLRTYRELAGNEFLEAPFERLIVRGETRIKWRLASSPQDGDSIGLIVTAFFRSAETGREFFFRRRLELPVKPGAKSRVASPEDSSWGTDDRLLKIGDRARTFDLPLAGGAGRLALERYLGKKKIILTTYRASW